MTSEEQLIQRLDRMESEIRDVAESARAVKELRDQLAPRVNEAVHALIVELADIEEDFQLEDLVFFLDIGQLHDQGVNRFIHPGRQLIPEFLHRAGGIRHVADFFFHPVDAPEQLFFVRHRSHLLFRPLCGVYRQYSSGAPGAGPGLS